jgi:phage repressor protein C with HTH and peptisase S24 domain
VLVKCLRKLSGNRVEAVSNNPKQASDAHASSEIRIVGRAVARLSRI